MSERRNKKAKVFDCKSSRLLTVPSIFSPIAFTKHMNKMSNRNIWWKRLFHGEYICMDFRTYCYHHKIPDRIKATRHILTIQQYRMSGSYPWLVSVCMCMGTTASSLCSHWSKSEKKNVENKMINTESWRFIQNETCGVMAVTRVAMASFVCP